MATRDLVLRMVVENQQANTALGNYNQALTQAKQKNDQLATGIQSLNRSFNSFNQVLNFSILGMSAFKLLDMAGELRAIGEKANVTEAIFTRLSGGTAAAADSMADLRAQTMGIVPDFELMGGASRMLAMGLASSNDMAERLVGGAVKLGAAFGQEAGPAIENFALLLANQSFLRLDSLGISASAVRLRVNELAAAFPDMSKEVRFSTAVMEEMDTTLGKLGPAAEAAGTSFRRLGTEFENIKVDLGQGIAAFVENLARPVDQSIQLTDAFIQRAGDLSPVIADMADQFRTLYDEGFSESEFARAVAHIQQLRDNLGRLPSLSEVTAPIAGGLVSNPFSAYASPFDSREGDLYGTIIGQLDDINEREQFHQSLLASSAMELERMEISIKTMTASNVADTTAGLLGISDLLGGGITDFMDVARDFAEVLPERENPFELWADSLENAADQARDIREETLAATEALRAMQSTGVEVDREGNKPVEQYDADKNLIAIENLVSVLSNESGGMKPDELDYTLQEKGKYAEAVYSADADAQAEAYAVGVRSTVWDMIAQALGTETHSFRMGEGNNAWDTPMPERLTVWDMMRQEGDTQQHGFRMGEAGGSMEGLTASLDEASEPMAELAGGFQTSADNAALIEGAMDSVRTFAGEALGSMSSISQQILALKQGNTDIPIRLILDQHHFFVQVSNALSLFQMSTGGAR